MTQTPELWPGDYVKVTGHHAATSDPDENYIGRCGVVTAVEPDEGLPVHVVISGEEASGDVRFAPDEVELKLPGRVSQLIAELREDNAALRARLTGEPLESARLSQVLERDRTRVADGVNAAQRVLDGYSWLAQGRGPYAHDDAHYQQEFASAMRELSGALEPLRQVGADWSDCPTSWVDVQAARRSVPARPLDHARDIARAVSVLDLITDWRVAGDRLNAAKTAWRAGSVTHDTPDLDDARRDFGALDDQVGDLVPARLRTLSRAVQGAAITLSRDLSATQDRLSFQVTAAAAHRADADAYFSMIEHLVHELRTVEDGVETALRRLGQSRRMHQNSTMKTVKSLVVCALDAHDRRMRDHEDAQRNRTGRDRTAAPDLQALLAGRPEQPTLDWSAQPFGTCTSCETRGAIADGQCGGCHDSAFIAEWRAYATRLETALRAQTGAVKDALTTGQDALQVAPAGGDA